VYAQSPCCDVVLFFWDHSHMTQSPVPPTQKSLPPARPADLLPPASNTELALTLVWRLVLTLVSGAGLILMFAPLKTLPQVMNQVLYFTTISNILVFLVALSGLLRPLFFLTFPARRKLEGNLGWLRGLPAGAALCGGQPAATQRGGPG